MARRLRSIDEARHSFDAYAALEPRLDRLWHLCRDAAPPARSDVDDDTDPYAIDVFAADRPDDGWCAEHYFFEHVKSRLMLLVGTYRRQGPTELQTTKAYDAVYTLLLESALNRCCSCCAGRGDDDLGRGHDERLEYR